MLKTSLTIASDFSRKKWKDHKDKMNVTYII